jgi:hypothetical protein
MSVLSSPVRAPHGRERHMIRRSFSVLAFSVLMISAGCHSGALEPTSPVITATTISVDQLPTEFDGTRTYHYRVGTVSDPQGMLVALWESGLESKRAWQPLDNLCLDPVGPQFTVEFVADDPRIPDYGFERADGRLHCATTLTAYTISLAGS